MKEWTLQWQDKKIFSTTSGNTAIPETIVTNATLAYAERNDTMISNATLPMSLIGNGTS